MSALASISQREARCRGASICATAAARSIGAKKLLHFAGGTMPAMPMMPQQAFYPMHAGMAESKRSRKCYNCEKFGHYARDCWLSRKRPHPTTDGPSDAEKQEGYLRWKAHEKTLEEEQARKRRLDEKAELVELIGAALSKNNDAPARQQDPPARKAKAPPKAIPVEKPAPRAPAPSLADVDLHDEEELISFVKASLSLVAETPDTIKKELADMRLSAAKIKQIYSNMTRFGFDMPPYTNREEALTVMAHRFATEDNE